MSAKAQKLAAELFDELRTRLGTGYTITEGFDSDGWATLLLSHDASPATTEDNAFIRVRARDWDLAKDVIGNDQTVYTPSVIQIVYEAPSSGGAAFPYVTAAHTLNILQACCKRGTRVELWTSDNGTVPDGNAFVSGDLVTSIEPDLYWPMLSSQ
jgi:hypothetical protein